MASVLSSSLDIAPESSIPGGDQVGGILVVLFIVTAVILFVGASEEWSQCIEAYGFAAELDPEGDTPEMQAAVAHAWEMMRTSGPGTPAAKARAARLRDEARAACAAQQWNTCFASYERAASLDPDGDTPEMKAEHDEALAEARKQER